MLDRQTTPDPGATAGAARLAADIAPVVQALLAEGIAASAADPVQAARTDHETKAVRFTPLLCRASVGSITNEHIPGAHGPVPVRIYRPADGGDCGHLPTVLWIHGGGWVTGSLETADIMARELCAAGTVVVTVDYRLAPEAPFPAGLQDCHTALQWVTDSAAQLGGDPGLVVVGGDSAGGNLAAVLAHDAAARDLPLAGQLLLYPVTDADFTHTDYPSRQAHHDGPLLTVPMLRWAAELYLDGRTDPHDPRVSPLRAASHRGLAPTVLITAEVDLLRGEGQAYGDELEAAGVPLRRHEVPGAVHGSFDFLGASPTTRAILAAGITDLLHLVDRSRLRTAAPPQAAEPQPGPDEVTDPVRFSARYTHPLRSTALGRSPLSADARRALVPALLGMTPAAHQAYEQQRSADVSVAATQLLTEALFAADVARLPFVPGDRLLAVGDSITDDDCSWAELLRVVLATTDPGVTVVNAGISGNVTTDVIDRLDLLAAERPTWVLQMLGTNDARRHGRGGGRRIVSAGETLRNLDVLAHLVTVDLGSRLVRMTPTPVRGDLADAWPQFAPQPVTWRTDEVEDLVHQILALDPHAVDLHTALSGPDQDRWLLPDGVHPTVAGQQQILRTLVAHLAAGG